MGCCFWAFDSRGRSIMIVSKRVRSARWTWDVHFEMEAVPEAS